MQTQIDRILTEQTGGVAVLSGAGKFEALDWTVDELGGMSAREYTRAVIVAVTGVPPTLLGLQSANYATAEMERRSYIADTLTPLASLIDDALTDLVRRLGFPDMRVCHVLPEMEDGRTERLQRVALHIAHGMSPADAYRFDGSDDAPDLPECGVDPDTPGAPVDAPEPAAAVDAEAVADIQAQADALASMLTDDDPDDEDDIRTELGALLDLLGPMLRDQP